MPFFIRNTAHEFVINVFREKRVHDGPVFWICVIFFCISLSQVAEDSGYYVTPTISRPLW